MIISFTDDDRNQVWLSVKPSVLQKSLVKLRVPVVIRVVNFEMIFDDDSLAI
jgi:hypothetical protein